MLKRAWVRALALGGAHRWRPGPSLLVLMYHRVLPRGTDPGVPVQPGMFVHADTFEQQLMLLRARFTPVPLREWIERRDAGRPLPRRAVALTFDDGWLDNHRHAFPLLRRYGIPATIFLVSDFVGSRRLFWPERLGLRLRAGSADDPWLSGLLAGLDPAAPGTFDTAVRRAKALPERELERHLPPADPDVPRQLLDWDEVREMAASGIVDFGSHTCTHTRLREDLPEPLLLEEVARSRREIEARLGAPAPLFCYPNGDHTPAAMREVRRHYRAACTTRKGWNDRGCGDHLRRIGIHEGVGYDEAAFMARLSGWA